MYWMISNLGMGCADGHASERGNPVLTLRCTTEHTDDDPSPLDPADERSGRVGGKTGLEVDLLPSAHDFF